MLKGLVQHAGLKEYMMPTQAVLAELLDTLQHAIYGTIYLAMMSMVRRGVGASIAARVRLTRCATDGVHLKS